MQTQFPSTTTYASLGQRLRAHRVAHKLSVSQTAEKLRLSVDLVEAMEQDDHVRVGTALFARTCLCNYACLVDVPSEAVDAQFAHSLRDRIPTDVIPVDVMAGHFWRRAAQPGMQLMLGAAIALLIGWMALHSHADASPGATAMESQPSGAMAPRATSFATSLDIGGERGQTRARDGIASLVSPDDGLSGRAGAGSTTRPEAGASNFALSSGGPKKPPLH